MRDFMMNEMTLIAKPFTDKFIDPENKEVKDNLDEITLTETSHPTVITMGITVEFKNIYDAGVIIIQTDCDHWAKLCFEYSTEYQPTVVSVVNKGVSDDCNSVPIESTQCFFRVALLTESIAFYYSTNNEKWNMVRYFSLQNGESIKTVSIAAQSPQGDGCRAFFQSIEIEEREIKNVRDCT